tara:strand:+ start:379 stop:1011 length:633 start_codon:yes stop_codon:yes gene_type:complete
MSKFKFLHVGCGPKRKDKTTKIFNNDEWEEVTFDIDPKCNPNILGSMTDLSMIEDNTFDAIYSSHNIEHLFTHEAVIAAKEFLRVIKNDGYIMIVCPDLLSTCKAIIEKGPLKPLYHLTNPNTGELDKNLFVAGIDILYGWRLPIQNGNEFMAHKSAYTENSLTQLCLQAGFKKIVSTSRENFYDINLLAFKNDEIENQKAEDLLKQHIS